MKSKGTTPKTTGMPDIMYFRDFGHDGDQSVLTESKGPFSRATYSVDEAVNKVGYGRFQIRLTVLSGLGWMADAIEIIILSIIGQFLACDWEITRIQNALLTSVVFGGMMVGSPVLGTVADKFGRKKSFGFSLIMMFVFGSVSAASPSYVWMMIFRCLTGFALGGVPQALTLCSEYVPSQLRGRAGFYICYFWSAGTFSVILLAWGIMTATDNWRILLAVSATPVLISIISLKWYPESARFYLVSDKYQEAEIVLQEMADMNKKELPSGKLTPASECSRRGRITDLLSPDYRISTLLFWYLWLATAFCYYGITLMSPVIIQEGHLEISADVNRSDNFMKNMSALVPCEKLSQGNYIDLLWTSAAEFPGLLIFTFLVEKCNRKKLMSISCFLSGILIFLLLLDVSKGVILFFLFGARAILVAIFQLTLVMTAEAFPTTLRAIAMGSGSSFCRLGGLICPYVAQVLITTNPIAAVGVLGGSVLLAGIAAAFLPLETRGMELLESHVRNEKEDSSHVGSNSPTSLSNEKKF